MLHLSRLIGQPVRDSSADTIGVIDDLIAAVGTSHPPITGLVVRTGRRRIYLGWGSVERMDAAGATILATRVNISRFRRRDDEILLPVHFVHLVDMGLTQGQNWNLEGLAADCADDGQYTFLLSAPPEPLVGGVGSPVHPVAIK